jgi:hypothetical protein
MILWQELAELFLPNRADFLTERLDGEERSDNLYDNAPQLAARGLYTSVATMLRPPGKTWFKAKAKNNQLNSIEAVRTWLYQVTQITFEALYDPRVNTEKVLSEVDADLVVFGTGIADVGWNKARKHLTIKANSLANTVLFAGNDGNPDGSAVFSKPTLRQIVEQFGEDKLTEKMRNAYDGPSPKLDEPFELCHVCIPNADYQAYGGKTNGKFPYRSLWFSVGCRELIDESGYYEFPKICPRWETLTGEVYGRSCAMVALPDSRVTHAMAKTFLEAGEMSLRPPTWSYADMIRGDLEMWPGGHTVVDASGYQGAGAPIQPIQLGAFPDKIFEVYQKKVENVAAAFFRDILELPSARDADMTATEINARLDQFLRQAAPIFNRVEHTYNAPLINRVFNILMREGMYPEPPEEMWDQEVDFDYESPIKAARDKAEALKVVEGLQMMLPLAEANPEMVDNIDFDAVARFIGIKADLPQIIFKPIDQMMAMREDRAKKIEMAQQAEMASKVAPAAGRLMDSATKAKQGGMLGFDQPLQIASPGLVSGESADFGAEAIDAIYEEVA